MTCAHRDYIGRRRAKQSRPSTGQRGDCHPLLTPRTLGAGLGVDISTPEEGGGSITASGLISTSGGAINLAAASISAAGQIFTTGTAGTANVSGGTISIAALRSEHRNLESTHEFEIAIARDPNSASAYDNLGAAMYRLGQPEKAIPLIEKALRLSPRDTAASIFEWHLGTAHMFLHDYDGAIEHFLKARAANPKFVWQLFHLAGA